MKDISPNNDKEVKNDIVKNSYAKVVKSKTYILPKNIEDEEISEKIEIQNESLNNAGFTNIKNNNFRYERDTIPRHMIKAAKEYIKANHLNDKKDKK